MPNGVWPNVDYDGGTGALGSWSLTDSVADSVADSVMWHDKQHVSVGAEQNRTEQDFLYTTYLSAALTLWWLAFEKVSKFKQMYMS